MLFQPIPSSAIKRRKCKNQVFHWQATRLEHVPVNSIYYIHSAIDTSGKNITAPSFLESHANKFIWSGS